MIFLFVNGDRFHCRTLETDTSVFGKRIRSIEEFMRTDSLRNALLAGLAENRPGLRFPIVVFPGELHTLQRWDRDRRKRRVDRDHRSRLRECFRPGDVERVVEFRPLSEWKKVFG